MERKALSMFILMCVVIGMVAGQSNALFGGFKNCMKTCLMQCAIIPPWTPACPALCLGNCIIHPSPKLGPESTHQFCTSGCASSTCSNLISKHNYRLDEVEVCVDGCSQTCVTN